MSQQEKDLLVKLEQLLARGVPRATEPVRAKTQLAGLYYVTKAFRATKAARLLVEKRLIFEAYLAIRSLYNTTVDFLWLCQDLEHRAERFYDSTAVSLEQLRNQYERLGGVPSLTESVAKTNQEHFRRVHIGFRDKKGKLMKQWAPGSIRNRALELAKADANLEILPESYDWLYGTLSDFEHSAPWLAFQYLEFEDRTVRGLVSDSVTAESIQRLGNLMGILLGLIVQRAIAVGILTDELLH